VEDSWKTLEFMVLPFKDFNDVFILGGTDDVQVNLDESNINIQTIASSRHVGPIKPRVDEWVKQLELFGKTLVSLCEKNVLKNLLKLLSYGQWLNGLLSVLLTPWI